jgi:actin-like ATPase involved in cell morphogenesis
VPSVVWLREDGVLLVGDAAARRAVVEPRRVAREFKRRVGDRVPVMLADQPFGAEALLAAMVAWIVERVSEREGGSPGYVTLTCPANWGEFRRGLLRRAAADAGLVNAGLVVEPVAAAIHYASQERVEPGAFVGVYDLGGGTFDATVLRKSADGFEVYGSPEGDDRLGGVDFDQAVMAHVAASLGARWSGLDLTDTAVLRAVAQVRANAVEAKEALSTDTEAGIAVIVPGLTVDVRLTRGEFEAAVRLPLQRTVEVFRQAVVGAGLEPGRLSRVLLVGGSSRIPLVSQLLTQQLGVQVAVDAHPKYAVCLGAAVAAGTRLAVSSGGAVVGEAPVGASGGGAQRRVLEGLVARPAGPAEASAEEAGAGESAEPVGSVTREFAAIVGDDTVAVDPGDSAAVEVDLVERGLTAPQDIAITEPTPAAEREWPDDASRVRPFDRVQRGRARRPLITVAIVAVVLIAGAGAVWAVMSQRPPAVTPSEAPGGDVAQGDQNGQPDPPPADPSPSRAEEPEDEPVGRFDLASLELTDVSPPELIGADNQIEGIATRDGAFVAVGRRPSQTGTDALVLRSPDGQTWTAVDDPQFGGDGDQRMFAAIDGPQGIVGVGVDGTPPDGDGAIWAGLEGEAERIESDALGGEGFQEVRDIVWHDGRYIAVGCSDAANSVSVCDENTTGGQQATVWTSPDGRDWSRLPPDAVEQGTNAALRAVTPTTAGLVAVGHQQDAGPTTRVAAFWFSADGQRWSRVPVEFSPETIETSATGVTANDNGVLAVGYDDAGAAGGHKDEAFWFSSDGTSWEQVAPVARRPADQVAVNAIGLRDGFLVVGRDFVAPATFGAIWTSEDGRQWQRRYEDVLQARSAILRDISTSADRLVIGGLGRSEPFGAQIWTAPADG